MINPYTVRLSAELDLLRQRRVAIRNKLEMLRRGHWFGPVPRCLPKAVSSPASERGPMLDGSF
jgi:hypothetical protein